MLSGIIIEESLQDKTVLDGLKIVETKVEKVSEKFKTPWLKQWTMHRFEVPEVFGEIIAQKICKALETRHSWYADFKNNEVHFIVFKNKVFKINRQKREEYEQAKKHGLSLGIPEHQLDFF